MSDIIITIPKTTLWEDYKKELDRAANDGCLNFKVSNFPKDTKVGDKCFVVHDGKVKGYMIICGFEEKTFSCTTTTKVWSGKFIVRSGEFFKMDSEVSMTGFQGWKYYTGK